MYGFLLSRRWIPAHIALVGVVAIFVSLGFWQLRRLEEKRDFNSRLVGRFDMPVAPLDAILSSPTAGKGEVDAAEYRRARVTGTFDVTGEILLLNRSRRDLAGHHVLTPLVLDSGDAILVDRGWVPLAYGKVPVATAEPPAGPVAVTGVLLRTQVRGRFGPATPIEGRLEGIARVDIPRIARQTLQQLYPMFLQLQAQRPAQQRDFPKVADFARPGEGPHLGYAIQWFLFAVTALAVYGARVRSEGRRKRRPVPKL